MNDYEFIHPEKCWIVCYPKEKIDDENEKYKKYIREIRRRNIIEMPYTSYWIKRNKLEGD